MKLVLNLKHIHNENKKVYLTKNGNGFEIRSKFPGIEKSFGCGHKFENVSEQTLKQEIVNKGSVCPKCANNRAYFSRVNRRMWGAFDEERKASKDISMLYPPFPSNKDDTVLGKGGYGKVIQRTKTFAEKRFKDFEDFVLEVVLSMLVKGHPNVIEIVAAKSDLRFKEFKILMPAYGMDLNDYMSQTNKKSATTDITTTIFFDYYKTNLDVVHGDIQKALCYVHDCGVIHNDVKAGNILLEIDQRSDIPDKVVRAVLADFGFGMFVFDRDKNVSSRPAYMVQTPANRAPEVFQALANQSGILSFDFADLKKFDYWAFGISLVGAATFSYNYFNIGSDNNPNQCLEQIKGKEITFGKLSGHRDFVDKVSILLKPRETRQLFLDPQKEKDVKSGLNRYRKKNSRGDDIPITYYAKPDGVAMPVLDATTLEETNLLINAYYDTLIGFLEAIESVTELRREFEMSTFSRLFYQTIDLFNLVRQNFSLIGNHSDSTLPPSEAIPKTYILHFCACYWLLMCTQMSFQAGQFFHMTGEKFKLGEEEIYITAERIASFFDYDLIRPYYHSIFAKQEISKRRELPLLINSIKNYKQMYLQKAIQFYQPAPPAQEKNDLPPKRKKIEPSKPQPPPPNPGKMEESEGEKPSKGSSSIIDLTGND